MIACRLIMTILSSHNFGIVSLATFYPDLCQACRHLPATSEKGFLCAQCLKGVKFIEPPICEKCGEPFPGDMRAPFICGNCTQQNHHFDSARSSTLSERLMRDVLHRYKYMSATWFEPFIMRAFLQSAVPTLRHENWDGVLPIPLYPTRLRQRGFNQSDRLALCLAERLQIPLMGDVLYRVKYTKPQSTLPRIGRLLNVKGAFQVYSGVCLSGKKLILVDDVMTTGATVNACAGALKKADALKVAVWTLARGGLSADLA